MLKKIGKFVGQQLLKSGRFKRLISEREAALEKQRDDALFARIMHAGRAVHHLKPERFDPYQTLVIVTDDGMVEEYMNGRVVGQGYIDSVQWGGVRL